ncbi:MAG: hypothetical protein M5U09_00715 [Gammaproteobacteria bacterium]|nr:hypothetical protein [Gammaproteobacteria bacterium]
MQEHCAVFRTEDVLRDGLEKLGPIRDSLAALKLSDRSMIWNTDLVESLELQNLMDGGPR